MLSHVDSHAEGSEHLQADVIKDVRFSVSLVRLRRAASATEGEVQSMQKRFCLFAVKL